MEGKKEDVDFWSLDRTLLNTERGWFGRGLEFLAVITELDPAFVRRQFYAVDARRFTFPALFQAIGAPQGDHEQLESRLRVELGETIEDYLYAGVLALLEQRKRRGIRQVLVIAGDIGFQKWKFGHLRALHGIFDRHDRHFVATTGSKGERIASYRSLGRKNYLEDSAPRHHEVMAWNVPGLRHIRPQWPNTDETRPEPGDGQDWTVTRNIEELTDTLEAG